MAYEIRIKIDGSAPVRDLAVSMLEKRYDLPEILIEKSRWLNHRDESNVTRRINYDLDADDDEYEEYIDFTLRFDEREDIDVILKEIHSSLIGNPDWYKVEYRKNPIEYDEANFQRDSEYYDSDLMNGLRSEPSVRKSEHLKVDIGSVDFIIDGKELSVDREEKNLNSHDIMMRKDRIIVTDQETIRVVEGVPSQNPSLPDEPTNTVTIATVLLYPSEIIDIEEKTQKEQYEQTDWEVYELKETIPDEVK